MISVPEIVLERISVSTGREDDLVGLAHRAVDGLAVSPDEVGGVLAATFSLADRFPSLAVRAASWLGLPASTPAFDLQMACSAYPYAVYLAGRLAADTGKKVIVIDGDVQSRLVDPTDHATGAIFSDACTASVVSCRRGGNAAAFDALNKYFTICGMPVASSQYWNMVYGNTPEEVRQDKEGMQTMRTLGRNMAFLMKSIQLGKAQFGLPEKEPVTQTNFHH